MLSILSELVLKKNTMLTILNLNRKDSALGFCHIFGLDNVFKDLADPPHFSPEIGATGTLKKSPETAETMTSLHATFLRVDFLQPSRPLTHHSSSLAFLLQGLMMHCNNFPYIFAVLKKNIFCYDVCNLDKTYSYYS